MAEAAKQITTTWISPADAIAMIAKIYQSKTVAEENIAIGLVTGRVRWDCLELIVIKKRDSDPGRGDPEFWRRLRKGAVNWPEAWARRCVVSYARNRRPITLCDYTAMGIVVAREDVLGLISPAVRMKLAEMEAAHDAGQATPATDSGMAATPRAVARVLSELYSNNDASFRLKDIAKKVLDEPGDIVKKVLAALDPEIKQSGRPAPGRGLILRMTGHWKR